MNLSRSGDIRKMLQAATSSSSSSVAAAAASPTSNATTTAPTTTTTTTAAATTTTTQPATAGSTTATAPIPIAASATKLEQGGSASSTSTEGDLSDSPPTLSNSGTGLSLTTSAGVAAGSLSSPSGSPGNSSASPAAVSASRASNDVTLTLSNGMTVNVEAAPLQRRRMLHLIGDYHFMVAAELLNSKNRDAITEVMARALQCIESLSFANAVLLPEELKVIDHLEKLYVAIQDKVAKQPGVASAAAAAAAAAGGTQAAAAGGGLGADGVVGAAGGVAASHPIINNTSAGSAASAGAASAAAAAAAKAPGKRKAKSFFRFTMTPLETAVDNLEQSLPALEAIVASYSMACEIDDALLRAILSHDSPSIRLWKASFVDSGVLVRSHNALGLSRL